MIHSSDSAVNKLYHLIEIAEEAKLVYKNASMEINDDIMKDFFLILSEDRAHYANQLRRQIYQLTGEFKIQEETIFASLKQFWNYFKSMIITCNFEAIISGSINAEEAIIKEYKLVLNDNNINIYQKKVILEQLSEIEAVVCHLKSQVKK